MANVAVVGSTGLVGSKILSSLLNDHNFKTVSAFSRRTLPTPDPYSRLRPIIDRNSSQWPSDFESFQPVPEVFFSALGTTRAAAGGIQAQRAIDYDLNLDLARAAKAAGVRLYVLISSAGVSKDSYFFYPRMKAELEEAVSKLGFEQVILVKPGLILGTREESRPTEYILQAIAKLLGKISGNVLKDFWAQDAEVIARAAVHAALKKLRNQGIDGPVWALSQSDIVRLGRKEWGTKDD